jgi:threonine dehydrogenase-like Zn-dependent dehydrogenase
MTTGRFSTDTGDQYCVAFTAPEQAELLPAERDDTPLGPREVAGQTRATLISAGTELAGAYQGSRFPSHPGYAAVFEVERVGSEVQRVRPGDLAFCMGPHRTFQRSPEERVLRLPERLTPQEAVFARLMGVTMSTLTTTAARPPEPVVVTGLGLVGHLGAQIFASCGYAVTAVDPDPRRREIATQAGLRSVLERVPVSDPELSGRVALLLECSGHEKAVLDGCRIVRKKGEVALVGAPWRRRTDATAHELLHAIFHNYIVLRSGWEWELPLQPTEFRANSIFSNYAAALEWLAEGRIKVRSLYTLLSPREAQQAYQDLLHNRCRSLATVFDWTQPLG